MVSSKFDEMSLTPDLDALEAEAMASSNMALHRNRLFFYRFRKRWKLKLGKIASRSHMPQETMVAKACLGFVSYLYVCNAPMRCSRFFSHYLSGIRNWGVN